jgi:hypothetical protein
MWLLAAAMAVMDKASAATPEPQQAALGPILFKAVAAQHLARKYISP